MQTTCGPPALPRCPCFPLPTTQPAGLPPVALVELALEQAAVEAVGDQRILQRPHIGQLRRRHQRIIPAGRRMCRARVGELACNWTVCQSVRKRQALCRRLAVSVGAAPLGLPPGSWPQVWLTPACDGRRQPTPGSAA